MNKIEAELYSKLCEFKLDDPTNPYPMSAKLAWEYHWSEIYTLRAMCEYKKYIFLAVIAEGMVSPSSVIDCVWHYHLLYTRSYWEELCGKILKKSLHHYPGDSKHLSDIITQPNSMTLILDRHQPIFGIFLLSIATISIYTNVIGKSLIQFIG